MSESEQMKLERRKKMKRFLKDLTKLSKKHGIWIGGYGNEPYLRFHGPEIELSYCCNESVEFSGVRRLEFER